MCLAVSLLLDPQAALAQARSIHPPLINDQTAVAVRKGLDYLARTQDRQGSWKTAGSYGMYPVAMSALAGVALLMSGSTVTEGPYAEQIDRTTRFVLAQAAPNGLISAPGEESRSMYGHGFSMLFLGQVFGMEEDAQRQEEISFTLRRAVKLTARSQSTDGGWLYTPTSTGDEGSVTITQVQGLRSCRNAGVAVPKEVIDQAMGYLDLSMRQDGGIAYRARQFGQSRPPITAAAVVCWYNAGQYDHPNAVRALEYCKKNIGVGSSREGSLGHYYYAHMYLAQAMYLSGEEDWKTYFPTMRDHLLKLQNEDGSWDGDSVGRVYGTAIALVILQLPYNNLPIMQR
jgi:hypothetical protein